jgi:hypothetical protein
MAAATITYAGVTLRPDLILGVAWEREPATIVHELLGGNVAVTLRPASKRRGTMQLFFLSEAAALVADRSLALPEVFTLVDDDHPGRGMRFVVADTLGAALDPQTRLRWIVSAGFVELS